MLYDWGLFGLCIVCFLSATILPFASEAAVVFFLLHYPTAFQILFVATLGNSLGGLTNIWLGRKSRLWFKKINVIRYEKRIQSYGFWLAGLSWVPIIGDPLLIALGFYRTPLKPTIALMIIGKALRYVVIYLGFLAVF